MYNLVKLQENSIAKLPNNPWPEGVVCTVLILLASIPLLHLKSATKLFSFNNLLTINADWNKHEPRLIKRGAIKLKYTLKHQLYSI